MRIFIIYSLFLSILFADIFQPNGQHCSDYSYLNSGVEETDYVAMALKANSDIHIEQIKFSGIAIFDYVTNNQAKFKVELVKASAGVGTLEPRGDVIALLGEISDTTALQQFTFDTNLNISSGTQFFLKLTPTAPLYGTNNYIFTAKECWCDDGNCNENGILQLGAESVSVEDRNSMLWRTSPQHEDQLGVYTNTHFKDIQITYTTTNTPQVAFSCSDTLYLSNRSEIGTDSTDSGATWLHSINRTNTPYDFDAIGEGYVSNEGGYNAIGYNIKDNFIYGMYGNRLVKIDKNSVVKELGEVEGFPTSHVEYAGEFARDGYYYVTSPASADDNLYKIDIEQKKVVQTIKLKDSNGSAWAVRFWDMAIDKSGDYFYTMLIDNDNLINNKIAKIKISDGTITTIGNSHADLHSYIDLVFSDGDGEIFMMSSNNGFYKVNTQTGEMRLISSTSELTFYNDGTSCPDANITVIEPLRCQATATIFNDLPSDMNRLNLVSGKMNMIADNIAPHINAAGYNKKDNYIWGYDNDKQDGTLIRIGKNSEGEYATESFKVPNLSGSIIVGDVNDDGHLYLRAKDKTTVYVIDLDPISTTYLTQIDTFPLTITNLSIADWAFNPIDDQLYTITRGRKNNTINNIYKINPNDGTVELVGDTLLNLTGHFGATMFDKNGNMYVYHNSDGNIYKIDVAKSATASYVNSSHISVDNSDGAMCSDVEIDPPVKEAFTCNNEGIVLSSDSLRSTFSSLTTINLETKETNSSGSIGTRHINSIGYNVNDNFLYGIGFKNDTYDTIDLLKIDSDYNTQRLNIEGLPQGESVYALGDVDFNNTLYVSTIKNEAGESDMFNNLISINLKTLAINTIDLDFSDTPELVSVDYTGKVEAFISAADYAFNPKDGMLYTVEAYLKQLVRIDPHSGKVELLGDVNVTDDVYSVISFFDIDGNYLFTNKGGTKMYKIDISDPSNINPKATLYIDNFDLPNSGDGAKCAYSRLPHHPLLGTFNVERTNSGLDGIGTDERNAWYTQIVGRDFDYSVLFYDEDFNAEKEISNVTLKIELINEDSNETLYERYAYIPKNAPTSRVDVKLPSKDLSSLPATKKAIFRISYGIDENNSIIQEECITDFKTCYNRNTNIKTDLAKDNFAIRPNYYYMTISDKGHPIRVNTNMSSNNTPLRISAGYDYNLSAVAYNYKGLTSNGYTINDVTKTLEFLDKSNHYAPVKNDYNATDNFIDGKNTQTLFQIPEVGNYRLKMIDTTWTQIDSEKGDCDINSSSNSANGNIKVGCNIVSPDINLASYPDHFSINLAPQNLPISTHPDFIYMSQMQTNNRVAISYAGTITAQNEKNAITQNFTSGYFAQNVALDLNATTLSDIGIDEALKTSDKKTIVNFARTIEFNSDGNITIELNPKLNNLPLIDINPNKFTNGSVNLDIRYNIDKNISKTINPIQITFHSFKANSISSNSISHGQENPPYIPTGDLNLGDIIRNFYFAKVTPDRFSYPRINMNVSTIIRTPLSVDIFCDLNNSYCNQTGVINNTKLSGTTREQIGWYISTNHNGDIDGNVTGLIDNPTGTVTLTPNPTPLTPLSLPHGHNGMENARFNNCNNKKVKVTIITDPVLSYQPNSYILKCTDNNSSQWIGVGNTGNTLQVKPKANRSGKMSW